MFMFARIRGSTGGVGLLKNKRSVTMKIVKKIALGLIGKSLSAVK